MPRCAFRELVEEVCGELADAPQAVKDASRLIFQLYGTGRVPMSAIEAAAATPCPVTINGHPPSRYTVRAFGGRDRVKDVEATGGDSPRRAEPLPKQTPKKRPRPPPTIRVVTTDAALPTAAVPAFDFDLDLEAIVDPVGATPLPAAGFPKAAVKTVPVNFEFTPFPPAGTTLARIDLPSLDALVDGTFAPPSLELYAVPRASEEMAERPSLRREGRGRRYVPFYRRHRTHSRRDQFAAAVKAVVTGDPGARLTASDLMGPVLLGGCAPTANTSAAVRYVTAA